MKLSSGSLSANYKSMLEDMELFFAQDISSELATDHAL